MLPLQLGGSLSCGQVSTAGHMLCTALQTTQRFINTQIRLFMHGGEAEIACSTQPATLWEAASSPFPQPRPGKHHSHWVASTRLLPGRLESTLLPREAIGRFTTSPSAPLSLEHCPWGSCQHSQCHTTLMALWDQPRTPKPCGYSPLPPQQPSPPQRQASSQPSPATQRFPTGTLQLTLGHTLLSAAEREKAAGTPLPRAAASRSGPNPGPPPRGTPRTGPRDQRSPHPIPPLTSHRLPLLSGGREEQQRHDERRSAQPQRGRRGHGGTGTRGRWGGRRLSRAVGVGRDRRGRAGGGPEPFGTGARNAARTPRVAAAGRGASPLPPSVPAAPVRARSRHAWTPPYGFGVGTGGKRSGAFSRSWSAAMGQERCVPACPGSPQRPRFGWRVAGLEHHLPRL